MPAFPKSPIVSTLNTTSVSSTKNIVQLPTGEIMGSGRVVTSVGSGSTVFLADPTVKAHALAIRGISLDVSSVIGTRIPVQFSGEVTDSAWKLMPNMPVFLGLYGTLTQRYNATRAFSIVIGMAISEQTIVLNIQSPIFFT